MRQLVFSCQSMAVMALLFAGCSGGGGGGGAPAPSSGFASQAPAPTAPSAGPSSSSDSSPADGATAGGTATSGAGGTSTSGTGGTSTGGTPTGGTGGTATGGTGAAGGASTGGTGGTSTGGTGGTSTGGTGGTSTGGTSTGAAGGTSTGGTSTGGTGGTSTGGTGGTSTGGTGGTSTGGTGGAGGTSTGGTGGTSTGGTGGTSTGGTGGTSTGGTGGTSTGGTGGTSTGGTGGAGGTSTGGTGGTSTGGTGGTSTGGTGGTSTGGTGGTSTGGTGGTSTGGTSTGGTGGTSIGGTGGTVHCGPSLTGTGKPAAPGIQIQADAAVALGQALILRGVVWDPNGQEVRVRWYDANENVLSEETVTTPTSGGVQLTDLTLDSVTFGLGVHRFRLEAWDRTFQPTTTYVFVEVLQASALPDLTLQAQSETLAPLLEITAPVGGTRLRDSLSAVEVSYAAFTADRSARQTFEFLGKTYVGRNTGSVGDVSLYLGSTHLATQRAPSGSKSGVVRFDGFDLRALPAGAHFLTAVAYQGDTGSGIGRTSQILVVIDREAPTLAVLTPVADERVFSTVLVKGTAYDAAGVATLRVNGVSATDTSADGSFSTWEVELELTDPNGAKSFSATISVVGEDTLGNLRGVSLQVSVRAGGQVSYGGHIFGSTTSSVIYVLDISCSMDWDTQTYTNYQGQRRRGTRLDRARDTVIRSILDLGSNFRFNIIAFSTDSKSWAGGVQNANPAKRNDAIAWLNRLRATGATGTGPAVALALADTSNDTVVLVTDGAPNVGANSPYAHRAMIRASNTHAAQVHTIGIGATGSYRAFLQGVAADSSGEFRDGDDPNWQPTSGGVVGDDHSDNYLSATPVALDTPTAGLIASSNDRDWFRAELKGGESYVLSVYSSAQVTAHVYLGDPLAYKTGLTSNSTTYATSSSPILASVDTVAHVLVLAPAAASYTLRWTPMHSSPGDDHGDYPAVATTLDQGLNLRGMIEVAGDRDVFSFYLRAGRSYEIATLTGQDTELRLLRADGATVLAVNDDRDAAQGDFSSAIRYTAQTNGTYYAEVRGYGTTTPCYCVRLDDLAGSGPQLLMARHADTNPDGRLDEGDYVTLEFTLATTTPAGAPEDDLLLPVSGDTFGVGAAYLSRSGASTTLIIRLGARPRLRFSGVFDPAQVSPDRPSGLRVRPESSIRGALNGLNAGGVADFTGPFVTGLRALQTPYLEGRGNHAATLLGDGRVLITGGLCARGLSGSGTEVFEWPGTDLVVDGETLAVSGLSPPTLPSGLVLRRAEHTATLLRDGKVLVCGGFGCERRDSSGEIYEPLKSALLYDPALGLASRLTGSLNQARRGHQASLLPDGRVLIVGGADLGGPLASAELYDPSTGSFELLTSGLSVGRLGVGAGALEGGLALVGGQTKTGYQPLDGALLSGGGALRSLSLPSARYFPASVTHESSLYLMGGASDESGNPLEMALCLDPGASSFRAAGQLSTHRTRAQAASTCEGILIAGGVIPQADPLADVPIHYVEVWDPSAGQSKASYALAERRGHTLTRLDSRRVLISGGWGSASSHRDGSGGSARTGYLAFSLFEVR